MANLLDHEATDSRNGVPAQQRNEDSSGGDDTGDAAVAEAASTVAGVCIAIAVTGAAMAGAALGASVGCLVVGGISFLAGLILFALSLVFRPRPAQLHDRSAGVSGRADASLPY